MNLIFNEAISENHTWRMETLIFLPEARLEALRLAGHDYGLCVHLWPIEYVLDPGRWHPSVRSPDFSAENTGMAVNCSMEGALARGTYH